MLRIAAFASSVVASSAMAEIRTEVTLENAADR